MLAEEKQHLLKLLEQMPESSQHVVLDFAEFIAERKQATNIELDAEPIANSLTDVFGIWRDRKGLSLKSIRERAWR